MSRPYLNKQIAELEQIFTRAHRDPRALRALLAELEHRSTHRAVALRQKVMAELATKASQEEPARPSQPTPAHGEPHLPTPVSSRVPAPVKRQVAYPEQPRVPKAAVAAAEAPPFEPAGSSADFELAKEPTPELGVSVEPELDEPRTPEFLDFGSTLHSPGQSISAPDVDSLLAAWTTLEVLEPQPLPKPEELKILGRQMVRAEESPEPWNDQRRRRRDRERGVYWFVHLGEINLLGALESLLKLFPDESPEKLGGIKGTTTMAVVVLDEEGRPSAGKTFLSSFAWGYGRARAGELRALADFPDEERRLCAELDARLVKMDEESEILPVTAADLKQVSEWLLQRLDLPAEEVSLEPVCVRVPVRRAFEAPEPDLLNSFFLEDLGRVRNAFQSGDVGAALAAFVGGKSVNRARDVVREPEILDEAVAPNRIPLSRWPVRGRYPLVMMQQAAVNHAVRELLTSGLVGINGPPGTGKTTLLRDIVAKVVLDRSIAMSAFEDPQEAFHHVAPMAAGRGFLHLYRLDGSLLGHEMVVASSNNKAVENISREVPAINAIASELEPPLRYFSSIGDVVLQGGNRREEIKEGTSWGLAAAVLGNSANRANFVDGFWWHEQRGMQKYLRGIIEGWNPRAAEGSVGENADASPEVLSLEGAPQDRAEALLRWKEARKYFQNALERAEKECRKLEEIRRYLHARSGVEESLETVLVELRTLQEGAAETARRAAEAEALLDRARKRTQETVADREALRHLRPGILARLFATRRYREWRDRMAAKVATVDSARQDEHLAEEHCRATHRDEQALEERIRQGETAREELDRRLSQIRFALVAAQGELGDRLPDRRFWSRPEAERQKLSPWLGARFQAAREGVFAACFDLHRAFINAAAPRLRHNLGAAMMLLKGKKLSRSQEPARRSLWASLFLVVPVVSTTFASISRMFGPLGREQLGWLLIDEAGQAVPQAAVGVIWRSQRVIAIGDPMQIQPVVTLPQRLIDSVLAEHGIEPEAWSAPKNSLQSLADRASWFGTTLLHESGDVWVGSPLRVHRRCEEPMFGISNRVAYDGLMVQATPSEQSEIGAVLGPSAWFHVEGEQPGHWSPDEGELAARLFSQILARCSGTPDIFFITPFRLVQAELRRRLQRVLPERFDIVPWRWVKENVGTIHTFQGKEAEAVVLVLGSPSAQAAGARRWAGGEPNLLNVAVSRAKRRLYVVGNRKSWRDAGVFRTLDAVLPERSL